MINFFSAAPNKEQKMIFADLPGYGFNVASREVRSYWNDLMTTYISRKQVREFIFLIDVRRNLDDFEFGYMSELAAVSSLVIVLTKIDKASSKDIENKKKMIKSQLKEKNIQTKGIYPVSNLKKKGIENLRKLLFTHLEPLKSED